MSKRLYYVYCHNRTDSRDDDVLKIRAATMGKALDHARDTMARSRWIVGVAYRGPAFKREYPEWHRLLWGVNPCEV